ncbi:MAG: hypothetical protein V4436_02415 [Patescibacteria group bacterium]
MESKASNSGIEDVVKRELEKRKPASEEKSPQEQPIREMTFPQAFRYLARVLSGE